MYTNWHQQSKLNYPIDKEPSWYIAIIKKLRDELVPLRKENAKLRAWKTKQQQQIVDYQIEKILTQVQISFLTQQVAHLKEQRDSLAETLDAKEKRITRYAESLFGHGNHATNQTPTKVRGGQPGHPKTNRDHHTEDLPRKDLFYEHCPNCGTILEQTIHTKERLLITIPLTHMVEKCILRSQRQYCSCCKKEYHASDEQSLPFSPYGLNVFLLILILRYQSHLTTGSTGKVMNTLYPQLKLSKSVIISLERQAAGYLKETYQKLLEQVRASQVTYADETGWLIHGKKAWVWLFANEQTTIYHAGISRGKGEIESLYTDSQSMNMHDGYGAYMKSIPQEKQMYCWAHLVRFAFEEDEIAGKRLVKMYRGKEGEEMDLIGIATSTSSPRLKERVLKQKEGLIRSLYQSPDGTNNLAERELRPMVIARKLSFGSDSFAGFERYCRLASLVQTYKKRGSCIERLKSDLQHAVQSYDSS